MNAVMTPLGLEREASPLSQDADGVIRVGGTRVTLESVIALFEQGAGAEEIALRFDVSSLHDIYATLGYCLGHRQEAQVYLDRARRASLQVRGESERRSQSVRIRERLMGHRKHHDASATD
jgi:uncharacterized protein (DUF433 family)